MRTALRRLLGPAEAGANEDGALTELNAAFTALDAATRVARALEILRGAYALSSSFGARAAVMRHLVTRHVPQMPVC